jgi:hypothetical protein
MVRPPFPLKNVANIFSIIVSTRGPPAPLYVIRLSSNYDIKHIKIFDQADVKQPKRK